MVHQSQGAGHIFRRAQDIHEGLVHLAAAPELVVDQVEVLSDDAFNPDIQADAMFLGQFEDAHQHGRVLCDHRFIRYDQFTLEHETAVAHRPPDEITEYLQGALIAPDTT